MPCGISNLPQQRLISLASNFKETMQESCKRRSGFVKESFLNEGYYHRSKTCFPHSFIFSDNCKQLSRMYCNKTFYQHLQFPGSVFNFWGVLGSYLVFVVSNIIYCVLFYSWTGSDCFANAWLSFRSDLHHWRREYRYH